MIRLAIDYCGTAPALCLRTGKCPYWRLALAKPPHKCRKKDSNHPQPSRSEVKDARSDPTALKNQLDVAGEDQNIDLKHAQMLSPAKLSIAKSRLAILDSLMALLSARKTPNKTSPALRNAS